MTQQIPQLPTDPPAPQDPTELRKTLIELFQQYQPSLDRYQWPIERRRWDELMYCVLESMGPGLSARAAAKAMMELNMFDVDRLARLSDPSEPGAVQRRNLAVGILREAGFSEDTADVAISTLAQLADKVHRELADHIQRLVRDESRSLIDNVTSYLGVPGLDAAITRNAVNRWMQNVLNLPIYLDTEATRALCVHLHVNASELIAAADDLDINLAILDDVAQLWYTAEAEGRRLTEELVTLQSTAARPASSEEA